MRSFEIACFILVACVMTAGCSQTINIPPFTSHVIIPESFGAVGDGVHNDTLSLQKAIDSLSTEGGLIFLSKKYRVDSGDLILKENVSLIGRMGTVGNPGTNNKDVDAYSHCGGEIILSSDCRIRTRSCSAITGVRITRKDLVLPANDSEGFAGTAVEIDGEDCYVGYSLILGFEQAIHSKGHQRLTIEHVRGDCTNGIWVQDSWDICRVSDCHFWPFASVAGKGFTRQGAAYKFTGVSDGTHVTNCFEFGYRIGFEVSGCGVSLLNCFADGLADISKPPYTDKNTIGYYIHGYARGVRLTSCEAWSKGWAYVFEPRYAPNDPEPVLPVSLQACKAEQVLNGLRGQCDLIMSGCDFRGIKLGVRQGRGVLAMPGSKMYITNCRFRGFDAAIDAAEEQAELFESQNVFEECNQNTVK